MEDFADQVRQAQEAEARRQQEQLDAAGRLRAEQAATEAEVVKTAGLLARALRGQGVPTDIVVEQYETRIRKKLFGGTVRDDVTHHVLEGWVFGDTRSTFRDPDSRYGRTETSLSGFILAEDGSAHRCGAQNIGSSEDGLITVTVREPWGTDILNGPMDAVMMHMYRDAILGGLVQLAVKHRIDPSRLTA